MIDMVPEMKSAELQSSSSQKQVSFLSAVVQPSVLSSAVPQAYIVEFVVPLWHFHKMLLDITFTFKLDFVFPMSDILVLSPRYIHPQDFGPLLSSHPSHQGSH